MTSRCEQGRGSTIGIEEEAIGVQARHATRPVTGLVAADTVVKTNRGNVGGADRILSEEKRSAQTRNVPVWELVYEYSVCPSSLVGE